MPPCGPIDRSPCRMSADKIAICFFCLSVIWFFNYLHLLLLFIGAVINRLILQMFCFFFCGLQNLLLSSCSRFSDSRNEERQSHSNKVNLCASCPINWHQLFNILGLIILPRPELCQCDIDCILFGQIFWPFFWGGCLAKNVCRS